MQISNNAGQNEPYPPRHGYCPDYWESIERNNKETKKKETKTKKKVNIIDYNCNSPATKGGFRYSDQTSAVRTSIKKSSK